MLQLLPPVWIPCLSFLHEHHGTVQPGVAERVALAIAVLLGHQSPAFGDRRLSCRCFSLCLPAARVLNKGRKQRMAGEHGLRRMQEQGLKHPGWRHLSEGGEILGAEAAERSGDGCSIPLWFVLRLLCLLLLQLPVWKVSEPMACRARPASRWG